jgi:hypothetical protein
MPGHLIYPQQHRSKIITMKGAKESQVTHEFNDFDEIKDYMQAMGKKYSAPKDKFNCKWGSMSPSELLVAADELRRDCVTVNKALDEYWQYLSPRLPPEIADALKPFFTMLADHIKHGRQNVEK